VSKTIIQSALSLPFAGYPTHGTAELKYKFCRCLVKGVLVTMRQILVMTGQFDVLQAGNIINVKELFS